MEDLQKSYHMNTKIYFFLMLLVTGCVPGDPVIADYQGQLLEFGTEEPIEGAEVKILRSVFSGPTGVGSYEAVWQGRTDQHGLFEVPPNDHMEFAYCVGDSSFFDLGPAQAPVILRNGARQKFYLMGKSILKVNAQDTGQVNSVDFIEFLPYSPQDPNIIEVTSGSFPFYSLVFANYPQNISYRVHFHQSPMGDFQTKQVLTAAKGDTTEFNIYF
jgi:hypothetical protein